MDLTNFIHTASVFIFEVDPEGRVTNWNQAAAVRTGWTREEIVGASFAELSLSEDDKTAFEEAHKQVMQDFVVGPVQVLIPRGDGGYVPMLFSVTARYDDSGAVCGAVAIGQDVTELVKRHPCTAVTDSIPLAASQDVGAGQDAPAAAKNMNSFSYNHRLLTPLNSLLGFVDLLSCGFYGPLNLKQEEYLRLIDKSGYQVLSVIHEMLEDASYSAFNKTTMKVGEVEPKVFVHAAEKKVAEQFSSREVDLILDIDPFLPVIRADYFKCRQIVVSLLQAVLTYMENGGCVRLSVTWENNSQIRCLINYEGIDTAAYRQSELFSGLVALSGPDTGGREDLFTGEFANTHSLIRSLGGEMRVEGLSGQKGGLWFVLGINAAATREDSRKTEYSSLNSTPVEVKQVILIVEDDAANLAMIQAMLHARGFVNTEVASNGIEAIEKARMCHPDIILMDVLMPIMGGIEATRHLRKLPDFTDVPIIGVTACNDHDSLQQLTEAGCNEWLVKPVAAAALFPMLGRYIK